MQTFKIDDHVAVIFGTAGMFGSAVITGIHQTRNKIRYDLEITIRNGVQETDIVTRIYNVDSEFVISREDWLNINQKFPTYGTPLYTNDSRVKRQMVWENKVGEKWATWLNTNFEDRLLNGKEQVAPVIADGWTIEESRYEFVKRLDAEVRKGKIFIFSI